jgi:ribosomal protein S18 acetylase RimI-like enzyme
VRIDQAAPDELDAVVRLIAAEQIRPERNIPYLGTDGHGIRAELDALAPPWSTTVRVARARDGHIIGVVLVESDLAIPQAWIYGPWVDGDDAAWREGASALFDAALAQIPDAVARECASEFANRRMLGFATALGWQNTGGHHALTIDATTIAGWSDNASSNVRHARADDLDAITRLHDGAFPRTHTPGSQLLAKMTVIVAGSATGVVGYAAGRLQPGGEGYIEYVAVNRTERRRGLGRALVVALTRELMPSSPKHLVSLTVDAERTAARALYASLGFETATSFVAFWSETTVGDA